jgi:hypothetical protein
MTAIVVPFPSTRRRDFILRNAARIADAQPRTAEKLIKHAVQVQVETMSPSRHRAGPHRPRSQGAGKRDPHGDVMRVTRHEQESPS